MTEIGFSYPRIARILMIFAAIATGAICHAQGDLTAHALRAAGKAEALGYNEGDTVITIASPVKQIPPYCFAGCQGLKRVEFEAESRLTSIGAFAFTECESLEEIRIPDGVTSIGDGAFRGCRNLKSVNLPEGLRAISRETFAYCRNLTNIKLPSGLTSIGPLAFLDCRSLLFLSIPPSVTKIGNNAFGRCFSLKEITLPRNCRDLGSYAFADCESLERIVMPSNSSMLGELIFSGCGKLREIKEPSRVPPAIECESFLFEPSDSAAWKECEIQIPAGSEAAYRKSRFWKNFDSITSK